MTEINTKVTFEPLRRESNGNVAGTLVLKIYGNWDGDDFDHNADSKDFSFPRGGEQNIDEFKFDIPIKIILLEVTLSAKVHEKTAGQCCVQGHVHVKPKFPPIGGGIGKDLDPNCHPIP